MNSDQSSAAPRWHAVGCLLFAATVWGVFWYPLRLVEQRGMSGLWATFLIFGAAALVILPWLWRTRAQLATRAPFFIGLALVNGWCNSAFIVAVVEGNVVRVMLLFYLSPLWTVLLARWLLHERPTRAMLMMLLMALIGAMIMLWDPALGIPWPRGLPEWLALTAGIAFAASNVMVRKVRDVSVILKTGVSWWGVAVITAIWLAAVQLPPPPPEMSLWAATALGGGIIIAAATFALQYGVTQLPAHHAAIILLFELIAAVVSAQWLAAEVVAPQEWLGGALILLAAWLAARRM